VRSRNWRYGWRIASAAGGSTRPPNCARSLIAIAEQIGMSDLARVAGDVTATCDSEDGVAQAATLFRMIRMGDRSLTAVWNLRDLSL
jgi:hypothetical protein